MHVVPCLGLLLSFLVCAIATQDAHGRSPLDRADDLVLHLILRHAAQGDAWEARRVSRRFHEVSRRDTWVETSQALSRLPGLLAAEQPVIDQVKAVKGDLTRLNQHILQAEIALRRTEESLQNTRSQFYDALHADETQLSSPVKPTAVHQQIERRRHKYLVGREWTSLVGRLINVSAAWTAFDNKGHELLTLLAELDGVNAILTTLTRPFVRAWLLNEARLRHQSPGLITIFLQGLIDEEERKLFDTFYSDERRWPDLFQLRTRIQAYLGPGSILSCDLLQPSQPDSASDARVQVPNGASQRVVPGDLLRSPYAGLYELVRRSDDELLGLVLRRILGETDGSGVMGRLTHKDTGIFKLDRYDYLYGPHLHSHPRIEEPPYWAADLSVTLITLRFLKTPTAIGPTSALYRVLTTAKYTTKRTRMHIWALGMELGVSNLGFLTRDFTEDTYAQVYNCARERNWTAASRVASQRTTLLKRYTCKCRHRFYTASPIRLGPKQSLTVQMFGITKAEKLAAAAAENPHVMPGTWV
ncbi:hypothetical protein IWQ60_008637 [Tieghemiomyces parasiticus]|uniref:Uncharacterized protein n=1 Tax=Tieghemiomyces parasiticus TaxID=78921 RepID=A0A9W7ZVR9_9FUNG|nr:hypothetical protein IWQ60_008637 [Tieghemiomyces parasiticus]